MNVDNLEHKKRLYLWIKSELPGIAGVGPKARAGVEESLAKFGFVELCEHAKVHLVRDDLDGGDTHYECEQCGQEMRVTNERKLK